MPPIVEKVTAFVVRAVDARRELLLFRHPDAGIQIPAGTVEDDETPERAVLREAAEETGLTGLVVNQYLGRAEDRLPEEQRIIAESTTVYSRPDSTRFDWARLRKGMYVTVERRAEGFAQVTYEEFDRVPDPQYVTLRITGWVPEGVLADTRRRHFFLLEFQGQSADRWTVRSDNHLFTLFWSPLDALPDIVYPQTEWLAFLKR